MALAALNRWLTASRDSEMTRITHLAISDDQAAFDPTQTRVNPTQGATTVLVKAATKTVVDLKTFDVTVTVNGSTEFTGKVIYTTSLCDGATATDALSRQVRGAGLGVGVQAGDTFTFGSRVAVPDVS